MSRLILSQHSRMNWSQSCVTVSQVPLVFLSLFIQKHFTSQRPGPLSFNPLETKIIMACWCVTVANFSSFSSLNCFVSIIVCFNLGCKNYSQAAVWLSLALYWSPSRPSPSLPLCSTCACCLSVSVCLWSYSWWEGWRTPPLLPLSSKCPPAAV